MRNSIFQLMIHTLDPLAEGKHQALVWELFEGKEDVKRFLSLHKTCLHFSRTSLPMSSFLASAGGSPGPLVCFICNGSVHNWRFLYQKKNLRSICLLILSFDASGINTVCYEPEKTKRFLSLPARVTVLFHHPS